MKNIKKIVCLFISILMVFTLTTAAFADEATVSDDTYTIIINNTAKNHLYEAYQIITGTLYIEEAEGVVTKTLSDAQWGANALKTGAVSDADLELLKTQAETFVDFNSTPVGESTEKDGYYEISGLKAGYYLIKDADNSLDGLDDSYTKYILEIVEDSEISPKSSVPSVTKKVDDENDSVVDDVENDIDGEDLTVWQDSADHDIGDTVNFKLEATLASNVEDYEGEYKLIFHDTLSNGLTFGNITSVAIDGNEITEGYELAQASITDDPETEEVEAGTYLTVTFADAKALGAENNSVITILYTATLNENAVIGALGNPNTVYLEYANNPNWTADEETTDVPTGKTPDDKVIVFTYKTVINKIDPNGNPLSGAEFTLEKKLADGSWVLIETVKENEGTAFTFEGLDDGDYRLTETKAPSGYNKIEPIYFTVSALHDIDATEPKLTELSVTQKIGEEFADIEEGQAATFTASCDIESGIMSSEIINKAGAVLPETGGIGTAWFYIIGSVLVLLVMVHIVTRKRAKANV